MRMSTIASLLRRAKAVELDAGGNPIECRPPVANESSRGETVGDRLPVESEGGLAGRGGN